jgi:hypothetical protein
MILQNSVLRTFFMVALFPVRESPVNGSPERTVADFPSSFPVISEAESSPYKIEPFSSTKRINLSTLIIDISVILVNGEVVWRAVVREKRRSEFRNNFSNTASYGIFLARGSPGIGSGGEISGK